MRSNDKNNKIYAIDTDKLKDEKLFSYHYALQRPERKEKIDRIKFDGGKRLSLGAGMVMEAALQFAGASGAGIITTSTGKPVIKYSSRDQDYLGGRSSDDTGVDPDISISNHQDTSICYFNISHTKNIAVCAVSDKEVGIDIEHERDFKDSLIARAFTDDEIRYVTDYTRLWTIKESVMKWYGLGFSLPPEEISIRFDRHDTDDITADISPGKTGSGCLMSSVGSALGSSARVLVKGHDDSNKLRFTFFSHKDCEITVCSEYDDFTSGLTWL